MEEEQKNEVLMKKCTKCGIEKEHTAEFFHRDRKAKSGLTSKCKECTKESGKEYHSRPEIKSRMKEYASIEENKQRHKENRNKSEYKERRKKTQKLYGQKPENKTKRNKNRRLKRKNNPLTRVQDSMSASFRVQLKTLGTKKPNKTMTYVGATKGELRIHLNSGKYTMEDYALNTPKETLFDLEHIIPSDYFKKRLKTDENNKITKETEPWLHNWWSYRNLRIWPSGPNRAKGSTIDMDLIIKHGIEDLLTL